MVMKSRVVGRGIEGVGVLVLAGVMAAGIGFAAVGCAGRDGGVTNSDAEPVAMTGAAAQMLDSFLAFQPLAIGHERLAGLVGEWDVLGWTETAGVEDDSGEPRPRAGRVLTRLVREGRFVEAVPQGAAAGSDLAGWRLLGFDAQSGMYQLALSDAGAPLMAGTYDQVGNVIRFTSTLPGGAGPDRAILDLNGDALRLTLYGRRRAGHEVRTGEHIFQRPVGSRLDDNRMAVPPDPASPSRRQHRPMTR